MDIPATLSVVTPNQQQAPNPDSFQGTYASIATSSMSKMQPSQNTMVVSASNTSYSTNPTEFTQQISDHIKQQIRLEFDDQFRKMKTTMTATQIEAAEAKTLATDVAKQLTEKTTTGDSYNSYITAGY